MKFFRGISVPRSKVQNVVEDIMENGLKAGSGMWSMSHERPVDPENLFLQTDLSVENTRTGQNEVPAICGCADRDGAAYYALSHNVSDQNNGPILMEFEAEPEHVAVDGKDFLYTVFQGGNPERSERALEQCFGSKVLIYAAKAWASDDQRYRIALCNLAIHDPEVIAAHHKNKLVIGGRHGTLFKSAFTVALPILPSAIIQAQAIGKEQAILHTAQLPSADISLRALL